MTTHERSCLITGKNIKFQSNQFVVASSWFFKYYWIPWPWKWCFRWKIKFL